MDTQDAPIRLIGLSNALPDHRQTLREIADQVSELIERERVMREALEKIKNNHTQVWDDDLKDYVWVTDKDELELSEFAASTLDSIARKALGANHEG